MDEAVVSGGEQPSAPIDVVQASQTEPLGSQVPEKPEIKPEVKPPASAREALQRANEAIKAKAEEPKEPKIAAEVKPDAKPESKSEKQDVKPDAKPDAKPDRAPDGKFAAKEKEVKPSFTAEAPARFSADAKAKWAETHESVRGETERAIRELTDGITKYKAAAERDSALQEFHEMAQKGGTDLKSALTHYVNMENMLRQNPLRGLEKICENIGLSLRDVAAHVLGQAPEETASAQDATIRELRAELADLKSQVGSVSQSFQQQQQAAVGREIAEFRAAHPRFDELSEDIAFFLKTRTADLAEAYSLAERLNPAKLEEASPAPIPPVQTDKGTKSISGAPANGSAPQRGGPVPSTREAIKRAMARASA